jgi:hypothetical protein
VKRPRNWAVAKAEWVTVGGVRFYARSRLEKRCAEQLECMKRAGLIASWEHEPQVFHFAGAKRSPVSYKPDFRLTFPDGLVEYYECKGYWSPKDVNKLRTMARHYPEVMVRVFGTPLASGDADKIERARLIGREAARKLVAKAVPAIAL